MGSFRMVRTARALAAAAVLVSAATACNLTAFTANTTAPVLKAALPALAQESDLQLAREAAPASLKTVEGFLLASPENETLIAVLAQGYCEYAFGFLETDIMAAHFAGKADEEAALAKRATGLYLRCMNYGLKLLGDDWEKALHGDQKGFDERIAAVGKGDVPGLFWVALGLASAINLNRDDIEMVAYMPKAKALFGKVAALDGEFYNGSAHMALGLLYCALSPALGGNPEQGKAEFDKVIQITGGKWLMPKVLMAMSYATVTHNQEFFHKTLVEVLGTSPAVFPDQRLANEIAQVRARHLLAHEKELF